MRIALYQPDIPQNTGNIFRLGACLGVSVDIIEPTGFIFDDKKFKRSAMDYIDYICLLYTSPSPRDVEESRMPSSA